MSIHPYVDNFISTLSGRQSEQISALMKEAKVSKTQIQDIVTRLENREDFAPTQLANHTTDTIITSSEFSRNVQDVENDIDELFEVARLISLLLVSQSEELSSRIEAAEREIDSMEKLVNLYSFLLADNKRFDEAYMETFHDERGRGGMIRVPDRAGIDFTTTTFGDVRVNEGAFVIPEQNSDGYPLAVNVLKTNAARFQSNPTNDTSMLVDGSDRGWKLDIATPNRVSSPLFEDPWNHAGAQALLEFVLPDPVPMTEIRLTPNTDTPTEEVLSIKLFESMEYNDDVVEVVNEPTRLTRLRSFHFPPQSVARFRVLLNQPVNSQHVQRLTDMEDIYRDLVRNMLQDSNSYISWFGMPYSYDELSHIAHSRDQFIRFSDEDFDQIAIDTLYFTDPNTWENSFQDVQDQSTMLASGDDNALPTPQLVDPQYQRFRPVEHKYHYSVGLKNVSASIESLNNKAAFVTDALPSFGDMGIVQLKADYENQFHAGSDRDNKQISSVEFSVSNLPNPYNENDWIPIQPVDEDVVLGERLFLDKDGVATLRFDADPEKHIRVYRQGNEISENLVAFIYDGPWIVALKIDTGTISQEEVFACDYEPGRNHKTIDFERRGVKDPPIAYAYSANGPGEFFQRTKGQNRIRLSNHPYLDLRPDMGEPIVVQLESGQFAINKTGETLDPAEGLSFIQNGRDIAFNKAINEPFRVFYYHLENNVRVRAVLRGNGRQFSTPKLYSFHLKGKVRMPERRTD